MEARSVHVGGPGAVVPRFLEHFGSKMGPKRPNHRSKIEENPEGRKGISRGSNMEPKRVQRELKVVTNSSEGSAGIRAEPVERGRGEVY